MNITYLRFFFFCLWPIAYVLEWAARHDSWPTNGRDGEELEWAIIVWADPGRTFAVRYIQLYIYIYIYVYCFRSFQGGDAHAINPRTRLDRHDMFLCHSACCKHTCSFMVQIAQAKDNTASGHKTSGLENTKTNLYKVCYLFMAYMYYILHLIWYAIWDLVFLWYSFIYFYTCNYNITAEKQHGAPQGRSISFRSQYDKHVSLTLHIRYWFSARLHGWAQPTASWHRQRYFHVQLQRWHPTV